VTAAGVRAYVQTVVTRYADLPGTPCRPSRQDRRLAGDLCRRGIPLAAITTALLLATARRVFRSPDAPPLAPIRTLCYFLPALDEVLASPPDPSYVDYLHNKLRPLLKNAAPTSTSGQKSALPGGR
jgi:hypothetical protein